METQKIFLINRTAAEGFVARKGGWLFFVYFVSSYNPGVTRSFATHTKSHFLPHLKDEILSESQWIGYVSLKKKNRRGMHFLNIYYIMNNFFGITNDRIVRNTIKWNFGKFSSKSKLRQSQPPKNLQRQTDLQNCQIRPLF